MSNSFILVCHETRQRLWIGQGADMMTVFYSGEPDTMALLGEFLSETQGKALCLLNCSGIGDEVLDYEEYKAPNAPD